MKTNIPATIASVLARSENHEEMQKAIGALQKAAASGNTEAIKMLHELHKENRFTELLNGMDDDESSD